MGIICQNRVPLSDGRRLGICEIGHPQGEPLIYFHGFPGSRLEARFAENAAEDLRVRIIGIDRPGYGSSDPKPGRTLMDWPDDIIELADRLAIDRLRVLGASGGAPYALACAFKMPARLQAVGIACGLGPIDQPGTMVHMEVVNRLGLRLARMAPLMVKPLFAIAALGIRYYPEILIGHMGRRVGEPDRELLNRPGLKAILLDSFKESLRSGLLGPARDMEIYARPWGFRLEQITMTVHLWHGEKDVIVPPSMGEYVSKALRNCRSTFLPLEGHFSLLINQAREILETLTKCET